LLASLVILGIIAAIAVPSISNIIENARKDATVMTAKEIVEATKRYIMMENPPYKRAWCRTEWRRKMGLYYAANVT
jgi:type II secretory pathway pseudopilin PulG